MPPTNGSIQQIPCHQEANKHQSSAVINHLKGIFANHGIPTQLMTDNGPPYSSAEFKHFMNVYGAKHVTSSPMYPNHETGLLSDWSRP